MKDLNFIAKAKDVKEKKDEKLIDIIYKKINKVVKKLSKAKPAPINEVYQIMKNTYYSIIKKIDMGLIYDFKIEEIFYETIVFKYGLEAKRKCEEILKSIADNEKRDEKLEIFGDFMGLGTIKSTPILIYLYSVLLKQSGLQLSEIFLEKSNRCLSLSESHLSIQKSIINLSTRMNYELRHSLLTDSMIYINGIIQKEYSSQKRNEFHLIYTVKQENKKRNGLINFEKMESYRPQEIPSIELIKFIEYLKKIVGHIIDSPIITITIKEMFPEFQEYISIKEIENKFYQKVEIEISLIDYLKKGVNMSYIYLNETNRLVNEIFKSNNIDASIDIKWTDFEKIIEIKKPDYQKWKLIALREQLCEGSQSFRIEKLINESLYNPLLSFILQKDS